MRQLRGSTVALTGDKQCSHARDGGEHCHDSHWMGPTSRHPTPPSGPEALRGDHRLIRHKLRTRRPAPPDEPPSPCYTSCAQARVEPRVNVIAAKIPKFPVRIAPLEDLEDGRAGGLDLDGRHVRRPNQRGDGGSRPGAGVELSPAGRALPPTDAGRSGRYPASRALPSRSFGHWPQASQAPRRATDLDCVATKLARRPT